LVLTAHQGGAFFYSLFSVPIEKSHPGKDGGKLILQIERRFIDDYTRRSDEKQQKDSIKYLPKITPHQRCQGAQEKARTATTTGPSPHDWSQHCA